jgi:hypothetical protein
MRGALHSGFATLISRMSWRISSGVLGRPPRGLDFQRQARKPARCHLMMLSEPETLTTCRAGAFVLRRKADSRKTGLSL